MLLRLALLIVAAYGLGQAPDARIVSVYPERGSFFGGTYLVIEGSGFAAPTDVNPWDAQAVYVGAVPCATIPHFTTATRIVCKTGPAAVPFADSAKQQVSVQIFSELGGAQIAVLSNAFQYRDWGTPRLHWSRTWAGTGGDLLSFSGVIDRNIGSTGYVEINVGPGVECTMDNEAYPILSHGSSRKTIRCTLPDDDFVLPGNYNITMRLRALDPEEDDCPQSACFPLSTDDLDTREGYGDGEVVNEVPWYNGRMNRRWPGTANLATGETFHFTVYPQVSSVFPSQGGIHGGSELTITGSSFSPAMEENNVTVGGVPCQVISASTSQLKCVLADTKPYKSMAPMYHTTRGLLEQSWETPGSKGVSIESFNPSNLDVLTEPQLLQRRVDHVHITGVDSASDTHNHYVSESVGFFVPPLTANYTFYIAGDDQVILYMGNNSGSSDLNEIARQMSYSSFSTYNPQMFYHRTAFGGPYQGPGTQISVPQHLMAGHRYPIRVLHREYGGHAYHQISMKVSGMENATNAENKKLPEPALAALSEAHPAMEVQVVRLRRTDALKRETYTVHVDAASESTSFTLMVRDGYGFFNAEPLTLEGDVRTQDFRNALRNIERKEYDPETGANVDVHVLSCRDISVSMQETASETEGEAPSRDYTITFNCPLSGERTRWALFSVSDSSNTAGGSLASTQMATGPVGGSFKLGYDGLWTEDLNVHDNWWTMVSKVSQMRRAPSDDMPGVELEVFESGRHHNDLPESLEFYVRFRLPRGDVMPLELDTTNLDTAGGTIEVLTHTVEDGEMDAVFLSRIPADYFEQPYPSPAASHPEACYSDGLAGYEKKNNTWLGAGNIRSSYGVQDMMACAGFCDLDPGCGAFSIHMPTGNCHTFAPGLTGLTSADDDTFHRCNVTSTCLAATYSVTECEDMNAMRDGFIYIPDVASCGDTSDCSCCQRKGDMMASTVRVESRGILGGTANTSAATFAISPALTLTLLEVTPSVVNEGTELMITLANVRATDMQVFFGEALACASVTLVDAAVEVDGGSESRTIDGDSQETTTSVTLTGMKFSCTVAHGVAGEHMVQVKSLHQGGTDLSSNFTVQYEPSIDSVTPSSGSYAGGTLLAILGDGISALPCSRVLVGGNSCMEPMSIGLSVEAVSKTLHCLTPASGSALADAGNLNEEQSADITIQLPEAFSEVVRATFTYSEALTPTIDTVSPALRSAAVSSSIVLMGSGFGASTDPEAMRLFFGEESCDVRVVNDSTVECWMMRSMPTPPMQAVTRPLLYVPGSGYALVATDAELESRFEVNSINPVCGSRAGGTTLVISGKGFHPWDASQQMVWLNLTNGTMVPCKLMLEKCTTTELVCSLQGGSGKSVMSRRLAATSDSASLAPQDSKCNGNGADSAKWHCLAKRMMLSGGVRSPRGNSWGTDKVASAMQQLAVKAAAPLDEVPLEAYKQDREPLLVNDSTEAYEMHLSTRRQGHILGRAQPRPRGSAQRALTRRGDRAGKASARYASRFTPRVGEVQQETTVTHHISYNEDGNFRRLQAIPTVRALEEAEPSGGPYSSGPYVDDDEEDDEYAHLALAGVMAVEVNGLQALCRGNCNFRYCDFSPEVLSVSPLIGSFKDAVNVDITISDPMCNISMDNVTVSFGETICPVASSICSGGTSTLTVPLCAFEKSLVPVYVFIEPLGYVLSASPFTGAEFIFEQTLHLDSVTPDTGASCGGTLVTLAGAGFSTTFARNRVLVGWQPCEIVAATHTEIQCYVPEYLGMANRSSRIRVDVPDASLSTERGFRGEYFSFQQDGNFMDPLSLRVPDFVVREPEIDHRNDDFPLDNQFAARWSAYLRITVPGFYTFYLNSDDGSRLLLNMEEVIDNGGYHGARVVSASRYMYEGEHLLIVQFFEGSGTALAEFQYSGPDTGFAVINVPEDVVTPVILAEGFVQSEGSEELPSQAYTYLEEADSPQIIGVAHMAGSLQVMGERFGDETGLITLGHSPTPGLNFQCNITNWNSTYATCTLPSEVPAGEWEVRVWSAQLGWSCPFEHTFTINATVTSVRVHSIAVDNTVEDSWVLIMKSDGDNTWEYDSGLWTNSSLLHESSADQDAGNAKYAGFLDIPFKRLKLCVGSPSSNCIYHNLGRVWASAQELFSAGEMRDFEVSQSSILRAFAPEYGSYRDCPMQAPGINIVCDNNKARFGYCASRPCEDCSSSGLDAVIGLGLADRSNHRVGAGWTGYFAPGAGSCSYSSPSRQQVWLYVESLASSVSDSFPVFEAGFGGGVRITVEGMGLGLQPSQTEMTVCGVPCEVLESNGTSATCAVPQRVTKQLLQAHPKSFVEGSVALSESVHRFFTDRGDIESDLAQGAYTSPVDQEVKVTTGNSREECWFAFELAPHSVANITAVAFFPPTSPSQRQQASATVWEVLDMENSSNWIQVMSAEDAEITGATIAQGWNSFVLEEPVLAQAFRIRPPLSLCRSGGDIMRGARFFGIVLAAGEDGAACEVELDSVDHPLARDPDAGQRLGIMLQYSLDRTPVLTSMSPDRGTARGDTAVTLYGSKLEPLDSDGNAVVDEAAAPHMRVAFNGYPCSPVSATDAAAECVTGERGDILPTSTSYWVEGKGYALMAGDTVESTQFSYIDEWSNPFSWLNSELPIAGDSVIIPEGQAILLDEDTPVLFFVMISGLLEFDRKDLHFQATYLWISGGHLKVGTEAEPFLHQAMFTMHGDRWFTIELPFIGSKMVAVTNKGGLHGGCAVKTMHSTAPEEPCKVDSIGKLDLHGRPDTSWTRLVETASAGSTTLRLAEPVSWLAGSSIVITSSDRGQQEELRKVVSVQDDGFTVIIDDPLSYEHLGIWYHHEAVHEPIDLRAAVGLRSKNIIIKGNDSAWHPGNDYLFGAHVGAFFGGEMRIENTEFTQTGQAANFGRYSSHWHVLSTGRTVDALKGYLRNNSYHDTFQRAVVVHSTDFVTVRDNVAHKTHGHSYFTEFGDEDYALFEHNLAVHPLPHHLLLDDDTKPSGFWLPGFTGWHRSNMVSNAVRGWRLRKLGDVASSQTDLTFYNNSVHASGHGWHLKPPHAPRTLNNFRTFTVFRCGEGMFYYSTGNIIHDDHRFVECGSGFHMNHLSNNINTAPFFHDLVLIGNIDPDATSSRSGQGLSGPKDNEHFFTSGATIINYFDTPLFRHCWETACTVRYERLRWFNSYRRTRSTDRLSGIFHDLDGTLTGYPNGFVTWREDFNLFPGECEIQDEHVNGIVCGKDDGSVRLRRLWMRDQEPWQLDGKRVKVITSEGEGHIYFSWQKLYGWAVPVVEGHTYDLKIVPNTDDHEILNDFQQLNLQYSHSPYVLRSWGYTPDETHNREFYDLPYTQYIPKNESLKVHLNYSAWRNHFDGLLSEPYGPRLSREPEVTDPFGAHSLKLWQSDCVQYNLSEASAEVCSGEYTNETGRELYEELIAQGPITRVEGRLTTAFGAKVDPVTHMQMALTPWSLTQGFTSRECPEDGCPTPPPPGEEAPDDCRLWSEASGWPDGELPAALDNVVIDSSECVILDITTPIFHWVTVNGWLRFSRDANTTLNAYSVLVWGTLDIGTEGSPIPQGIHATVALHGTGMDTQTVIMGDEFELGDKVLAVLGRLSAAGVSVVDSPWTRLQTTAQSGDSTLVVRGNMSAWPVGASVGIAPTEYPAPPATTQTETRKIVSVSYEASADATTVTLDEPLTYRHYAGVIAGEGGHWQADVELAAHVTLLGGRSNVVFRTAEEDSLHGGHVHVGGTLDGVWVGAANLSNVDFENMGQFYYQYPALKFNFLGSSGENARPSLIHKCVFSNSQAGAVEIDGAHHIALTDNVFHRTYRTALWLAQRTQDDSIIIERNLALETLRHPDENMEWVRPFAAFLLEVRPGTLYGNVAAGSADSGFVLRPQEAMDCSASLPSVPVAQVNEAVGCMTGLFILRADGDCAWVHAFRVWKSSHIGVTTADQKASLRLDSMVISDNHIGVALGFHMAYSTMEHRVYGHNLTIYGSTDASTCDASNECRAISEDAVDGSTCGSVLPDATMRVGIITHVINSVPKLCEANPKLRVCRPPNTPVKLCVMPWERRIGTLGARYAETHFSAVSFGYFQGEDSCGRRSVAFTTHPGNIDFTYPYFFSDVKWLTSVGSEGAFDLSTINDDSDAFMQYSLQDVDGTLINGLRDDNGNLMNDGVQYGSILPLVNPALATSDCSQRAGFFTCPNLKLSLMRWEAVGSPPERVLGSMKLYRDSDERSTWSRGPFGAECLPEDPQQGLRGWMVKGNEYYNLTLFASPPAHSRLFYFNDDDTESIRLAIFLTQPFRMEVYQDGVLLPETSYDMSQCCGDPRYPVLEDPHGSYTFDPHERRIFVTLRGGSYRNKMATKGGGFLLLRALQVVQLSMTVSVPVTEFDGDAVVFNIATLLRIDPARIKIASVQSRSQVAAQGGRLLASWNRRLHGRRTTQDSTEGTALIIQILEKNPAPIPSEAFSEALDEDELADLNITVDPVDDEPDTVNETNATNGSAGLDLDFNVDSIAELAALAETMEQVFSNGSLASSIGYDVDGLEVETTDPIPPSTTSTTTTVSTTTADANIIAYIFSGSLNITIDDPQAISNASQSGVQDALVEGIANTFPGVDASMVTLTWEVQTSSRRLRHVAVLRQLTGSGLLTISYSIRTSPSTTLTVASIANAGSTMQQAMQAAFDAAGITLSVLGVQIETPVREVVDTFNSSPVTTPSTTISSAPPVTGGSSSSDDDNRGLWLGLGFGIGLLVLLCCTVVIALLLCCREPGIRSTDYSSSGVEDSSPTTEKVGGTGWFGRNRNQGARRSGSPNAWGDSNVINVQPARKEDARAVTVTPVLPAARRTSSRKSSRRTTNKQNIGIYWLRGSGTWEEVTDVPEPGDLLLLRKELPSLKDGLNTGPSLPFGRMISVLQVESNGDFQVDLLSYVDDASEAGSPASAKTGKSNASRKNNNWELNTCDGSFAADGETYISEGKFWLSKLMLRDLKLWCPGDDGGWSDSEETELQ